VLKTYNNEKRNAIIVIAFISLISCVEKSSKSEKNIIKSENNIKNPTIGNSIKLEI
jgi:hypothetical protein